jgi:hypothetical protein
VIHTRNKNRIHISDMEEQWPLKLTLVHDKSCTSGPVREGVVSVVYVLDSESYGLTWEDFCSSLFMILLSV